MKKNLFLLIVFAAQINSAQNTFPTTGNVGIGTTAPAAKLHITNPGISGQLDYNLIIQKSVTADNNKSAVGLLFSIECCGNQGKSAIVHERTGGYGIGNLHFLNNNSIDGTNPTLLDAKMTITSNGNVGIGTTNPLTKLHVDGDISTSVNGSIGFNTSDTFSAYGGNRPHYGLGYSVSGNPLTLSGYYGLSLFTLGYERLRIDAVGNVGIGTKTPDSKLTVAGDIHSREVKVTVNAGADFVFEKEYNLPALDSVDRYIKENKHLPEIASAKEMQKDGINLSEMNIKLLQKVEELTLYMIEQNKKMDLQQKENAIQSKQIEEQNIKILSLQNKINNLK